MLTDRAGCDPQRFSRLSGIVAGHRTLADVVPVCGLLRWNLLDVIPQDEYTHDVIVQVDAETFLVYDTT